MVVVLVVVVLLLATVSVVMVALMVPGVRPGGAVHPPPAEQPVRQPVMPQAASALGWSQGPISRLIATNKRACARAWTVSGSLSLSLPVPPLPVLLAVPPVVSRPQQSRVRPQALSMAPRALMTAGPDGKGGGRACFSFRRTKSEEEASRVKAEEGLLEALRTA